MYQDQLDNNFVSIFLFYANLNRGTIMKKSTLFKFFIALPLAFTVIAAQTDTDAIEKARQAKEAAEKAEAEAKDSKVGLRIFANLSNSVHFQSNFRQF